MKAAQKALHEAKLLALSAQHLLDAVGLVDRAYAGEMALEVGGQDEIASADQALKEACASVAERLEAFAAHHDLAQQVERTKEYIFATKAAAAICDHLHRLVDAGGQLSISWTELNLFRDMIRDQANGPTTGLSAIADERERQILIEGWTAQHDLQHFDGSLSLAAGCYLLFAGEYPNKGAPPPQWPWDAAWWKPKSYRSNMVRAGALCAAGIDLVDSASSKPPAIRAQTQQR